MKLDRNTKGRGKYGVILNRQLKFDGNGAIPVEVSLALRVLDQAGLLAEGGTGLPEEYFVIMLKDHNAEQALRAYALAAAANGDTEMAHDVHELADRAGPKSPFCKSPD